MGKIGKAIKNGDLIYKMHILLNQLMGFSNKKIRDLELRNKKFKKIKKKYKIEGKYSVEEYKGKNSNVWILWLQGETNAPEIVKKCIEHNREILKNYDIHIITSENFTSYVTLPDYIIEKWKKGIISDTHFSDILRTELLIENGGIWLDATAYLMRKIPNYIFEKRLFLFSYKCTEDVTIKCNSWFIYSQKNNRTLRIVRDLLFRYWSKESRLKEYFLWHFFATMALNKYEEDYDEIYYITDETQHYLARKLLNKFDDRYWRILEENTFVYKLNYKYDKSKDLSGTYLEHIYNSQ